MIIYIERDWLRFMIIEKIGPLHPQLFISVARDKDDVTATAQVKLFLEKLR